MNDFRIDFVKSVANKLGWDQTSEDLDKGEIRYGENTVISFREKDYLNINIYWKIPHALSNVYKQICELANSNATCVKFAMLENYMVAYGGISNSIFFRDDVETELESFLSHIVQEANMSYHAMINAITKVLKNKLQ